MKKISLILLAIFMVFEVLADEADKNACQYARKESDIEIWSEYLKNFPNGMCAKEAKDVLNKVLHQQKADKNAKDQAACNQARQQNSYQAWEDYLKNFSNGKCNFEAKMNLKKLLKHKWSSRSSKRMNWNDAINYCQNLREDGYSNWRLPTISELRTTIKNCSGSQSGGSCSVSDFCLSGSYCLSVDCKCEFRKNNGGYYSKLGDDDNVILWSSSVQSESAKHRWVVDFAFGYLFPTVAKYDDYCYVRCVRNSD